MANQEFKIKVEKTWKVVMQTGGKEKVVALAGSMAAAKKYLRDEYGVGAKLKKSKKSASKRKDK